MPETTISLPSLFSHPAWMRAVSAHVPGGHVFHDSEGPFQFFVASAARLPFPHAQTWNTALTPCPLPSCNSVPTTNEAAEFLNAVGLPMLLRAAPEHHPVMLALSKAAGQHKVLSRWQRAGLNVSGSFDTWLMENFDHKRRKELKRLKARLSEQGTLRLDVFPENSTLPAQIAAFLALEAKGWKGKQGTAIGNDPNLVRGFEAGLAAMHSLGKLRFWTMWLDDKPIASLFALIDGGHAVLGKIGFDEDFAKYSPGVLLVIEVTQALFADPNIIMADANAIPGHPMIDRIWRDRIDCMDVVIAGTQVSTLTFQAVAKFYGMKDAIRKPIKRIYLRLTGKRSS